ncbi:hypothetical protein FB451DRAFT_1455432 [Mycena latifolia]|nr:hypothetical protein FB451DRAFT_1455432 [Mycena latifolia]
MIPCHYPLRLSPVYPTFSSRALNPHSFTTLIVVPRLGNSTQSFLRHFFHPSSMPFRQPLRDRCNVLLRVCTDRKPTSTKSRLRPNLTSSAGHTPPHISPARFRPRGTSPPPLPAETLSVLDDFLGDFLADESETDDGPRQFIPFLELFSPPAPAELPLGRWTHAVRLLPASQEHPAGSSDVTDAAGPGGTHILDLYVGAPRKNTALPLSRSHLLIARDFLALALPYYACAHPPESISDSLAPPPSQACRTDAVRVLLMGPPRAVLAMATAYIAYASGCTVAHVMRCVVDDAEDPEWCAVLGADARMGLGDKELRAFERVVKKGI